MTARILALGEVMLELSQADPHWAMNVAGDTFNTAWHLRHLCGPQVRVAYYTCLGTDPFSDRIAGFATAAGIDTRFMRRDASRSPGLYAISLVDGERSFTYWRDRSAARLLADDPAHLADALAWADMAYLSGITLAILSPAARTRLLDALTTARTAGLRVVFDPNIRPRLWEDADIMRRTIMQAAALADITLPSFDDEARHFGDADPDACADRYGARQGTEVVVKNGGRDVLVCADGARRVHPLAPVTPVDTSGAGDSFNAGWIAARLAGDAVASRVIGRKGALGQD